MTPNTSTVTPRKNTSRGLLRELASDVASRMASQETTYFPGLLGAASGDHHSHESKVRSLEEYILRMVEPRRHEVLGGAPRKVNAQSFAALRQKLMWVLARASLETAPLPTQHWSLS